MDYFEYRHGRLFCEDVDLAEIAASVGTPVYVYSAATLLHHYRAMVDAFAALNPRICFSVKSLANVHILSLLAAEGCGFDVVSGGEVARASLAGGDMSKVVFAGVGKTDRELHEAIEAGVGIYNVESEAEFENISRIAGELSVNVQASLRVNPDIYDPRTHTYTATGKKETKFGVDIERAVRFFHTYGRDENVRLNGIHLHIGSPIFSAGPYVDAITKALELISRLRDEGFTIEILNIGGGYAADYAPQSSPLAADYAREIVPLLEGSGLEIIMEPGRQIACNGGVMLTAVQYVKTGGDRNFVIVDAAMTDLLRPALYGAEHFIYPTAPSDASVPDRRIDFAPDGGVKVDIVGGVCENSDFLGKDRIFPPVACGDLLAVFSAGAYGFVMSSQYNSRPRAAEVLVAGGKWRVIRRRETYDDLTAPERDL